MLRTDEKASAESAEGLEKVVIVVAPDFVWFVSDRRITNHPRQEAGLVSDPAAATEKEQARHVGHCTALGGVSETPTLYRAGCRADPSKNCASA
jgi:hypothetical protein